MGEPSINVNASSSECGLMFLTDRAPCYGRCDDVRQGLDRLLGISSKHPSVCPRPVDGQTLSDPPGVPGQISGNVAGRVRGGKDLPIQRLVGS